MMACRIGVERFGRGTVETGFEELLERCARALREVALPRIPDGEYPFEDFVEVAGAVPTEPREFIRLKVAMIKSGDRVTFDFEGTAYHFNSRVFRIVGEDIEQMSSGESEQEYQSQIRHVST